MREKQKSKGKPKNRAPLPQTLLSSYLFRLLAMLAIALTAWTVAHILMPYNEGLLLLTFPLTATGYGLQLLSDRIFLPKNSEKVSFHRGIPGLILSGIFCLLVSPLIRRQLEGGLIPNLYYESDFASWTIFTAGFIFLILLVGIYSAMIPPSRFFSYNSAYTFAALYLILWLLTTLFAPAFKGIYLMIPAILITVFFLFAMNQSGIDDLSRRARVMGVTPELRLQNFRLTALMILLLAGIFFLALVVFTGLFFTAKMIGLILLRALVSEDAAASPDIDESLSDLFSGGLLELPGLNRSMFVLFIILVLLLIVLFFIRLYNFRSGFKLRELPGKFLELMRRLLAFLESLFRRRYSELKVRPYEYQPYQDTVTIAAPVSYRNTARSYDDYLRRMREIADERERFCFAYSTLIAGWRRLEPKSPNALSPSLTPREICAKLAEEGRYSFEQVTELYELIRYAELPVSDGNIGKMTERLSGYVQQYFNTL